MAFPASGTISFNNARTEMGQSAMTDYSFRRWASGAGCDNDTTSGQRYAPINVHSSNSGKYSTSCTNYQMSNWYNYDHSLNYASDGTFRNLFLSYLASCVCCQGSMIIFDLGTTNKTFDITIDGTSTDFANIYKIAVFYGKPWSSNGVGAGSSSLVYDYTYPSTSGLTVTINYNYTYNSSVGQYLYVVVYTTCF
jgi:hypothetical protein